MSKQKQEPKQDVQTEATGVNEATETTETTNTTDQATGTASTPDTESAPATESTDSADSTESTTAETAASAEADSNENAPPEPPAIDWQAKYNELNDRYLRMAAEYDNFRKRSQREREKVHSDAVGYAVKALLPTFDNLERAIKAETADAEYKKGVELTMTQLTKSLNELGVTPIESEPGTPFDPNLHNAMMHIDDDTFAENVIAEVFQKGFRIGDKIIRYAMVKVAN